MFHVKHFLPIGAIKSGQGNVCVKGVCRVFTYRLSERAASSIAGLSKWVRENAHVYFCKDDVRMFHVEQFTEKLL